MDIVVLCGGLSPERNVSISGGRRIAAALRSLGHRAALMDMYFGLEGYDGPLDGAFDLPLPPEAGVAPAEPELEAVARARRLRSGSLFGERALELCLAADLVFLALHGRCGEDGRVRAAFDLLGIRCTGSPYLGSAVAMDKRLTKLVARSVGVRTPEGVYIPRGGTPGPGLPGPPCVVKPVDSGSSLGVEIVREAAALPGAVERAMRGASGVLVEEYIAGREIQISILGGKALPGRSLLPAAEGGKVEERELFFEHQGSCAVIRGSWKLVRADKRSPWQLFDLEADPFETADLKEREPQRAADLEASWNRWAETHNVLPLEDKKWTQRINYYKQLNPDQDGID